MIPDNLCQNCRYMRVAEDGTRVCGRVVGDTYTCEHHKPIFSWQRANCMNCKYAYMATLYDTFALMCAYGPSADGYVCSNWKVKDDG